MSNEKKPVKFPKWSEDEKALLRDMIRQRRSLDAMASRLGRSPADVERRLRRWREEQRERFANGVGLIGLACLFIPGFPIAFWPGILFVAGLHSLASGSFGGAAFLLGLGIAFIPGMPFLPTLLIMFGIASIISYFFKGQRVPVVPMGRTQREDTTEDDYPVKRKNEELAEAPPKTKRTAMRLGPDGELIDLVEAEDMAEAKPRSKTERSAS